MGERRQTICSARAIVLRQAPQGLQVLVCHHDHPGRSFWCFPGGVVEHGEDFATAVRRELREETGLEIELDGLFSVLDRVNVAPDGRIEIFLLAHVIGGNLHLGSDPDRPAGVPATLVDVRWVSVGELAAHRVLPESVAHALDQGRTTVLPLDMV